jgi:hypothetical protein
MTELGKRDPESHFLLVLPGAQNNLMNVTRTHDNSGKPGFETFTGVHKYSDECQSNQ